MISATSMNENFQAVLDAILATPALPTGCTEGQTLESDGESWTCAAPAVPSGTITPGTGLEVDEGTMNILAEYSLPQECTLGQVAQWSGVRWLCATAAGEYAPGTGLTLNGNRFSVDFDEVARADHGHDERYLRDDGPVVLSGMDYDNPALEIRQYAGADALVTSGDIEVGTIRYAQPQKRYASIPAHAFTPRRSTTPYHKSLGHGGACIESGIGMLVAPIQLPDGARIAEVEFFYEDDDSSGDLWITLSRYQPTGSNAVIHEHDSSGTPGVTSANILRSGGAFVDVDNSQWSYNATVFSSDWSCDMNIRQVSVGYYLYEVQ